MDYLIIHVYKQIKFIQEKQRNSLIYVFLLTKCGIVKENIYKLYKLKVKDAIDEMVAILWDMSIDIMETCIFR